MAWLLVRRAGTKRGKSKERVDADFDRHSNIPVEGEDVKITSYDNSQIRTKAPRAGRNPSRAAFIDATWSLRKWDLGGFEISASTPDRNASRFVELTLVGRDGRFLR